MSTEGVTGPDQHSLPNVEKGAEHREIREQKVVRVFLYQSRGAESIADSTDLRTVEFTHMVLLRKGNDSVNPNQVMPVGGRVDAGESVQKAGMRECVEETHLRPTRQSLRAFHQTQEYEFTHPKKGRIKNEAHFLKGQLLPEPMDMPYQLDPEEDKIGSFIKLLPDEAEELFAKGSLMLSDGTVVHLLDSLSLHAEDRAERDTTVNETEVTAVHQEALNHLRMAAARKKLTVVLALLQHLVPNKKGSDLPQLRNTFVPRTKELMHELIGFEGIQYDQVQPVIEDVNALWEELIDFFTVEDVRAALEYSNLSAKLHNSTEYYFDGQRAAMTSTFDMETGTGIPTINLILPLLLSEKPNFSELRILASNPQALRILRILQGVGTESSAMVDNELIESLVEKKLIPKLTPHEYAEISEVIDNFFESIRDQAGVKESVPIDQLNEVKYASIVDLFAMARGNMDFPFIRPTTDHKVLRWEARRKLVLLLMFADAAQIVQYYESLGIEPIRKIEASLIEGRDKPQKNLTLHVAEPLRLGGQQLPDSHKYEQVRLLGRRKNLGQIFRKMMVRDVTLGTTKDVPNLFKDIEAETYIFNGIDSSDREQLEQKQFLVPRDPQGVLYVLRDADGKQLEVFTAPQAIADLITSLLVEGQGAIEIDEYKPLPEHGQRLNSSGVGGGGDVRLSKFYIKHSEAIEDESDFPIVRYREVQVFVPNDVENLSAIEEYDRKKADDSNYASKRLFHTKGLRSFMELMFPAEVYGDAVREMYKDKVK